MRRHVHAIAVLILGASAVADTPNAARGPGSSPSPTASRLAFASHRDGNWEIYAIEADGNRATRLTSRVDQDRFPLWSPDGTKIAFGSQVANAWELWVMDADGANARRLFRGIAAKSSREWSPDGTRIVFESRSDSGYDIFSVRADGSGLTRLTSRGNATDPVWSPDGSRIAFASARDGRTDIYVMRADGSDQARLTSSGTVNGGPSWSPDGSAIAFASVMPGGAKEVCRIHADGSHLEQLTEGAMATRDPLEWSPDGKRIAFQSARGDYNIDVVDVTTRARTTIAPTTKYDGMPRWSPDGAWLAFISDRDGFNALYVVRPDGTDLRRLTSESTLDPAWSVSGR